jgi:hypothetical protein
MNHLAKLPLAAVLLGIATFNPIQLPAENVKDGKNLPTQTQNNEYDVDKMKEIGAERAAQEVQEMPIKAYGYPEDVDAWDDYDYSPPLDKK